MAAHSKKTVAKKTVAKKSAAKTKVNAGKKLRYGFIGTGGVSLVHMRHLAARDDVELVAFADVDSEAMTHLQKKYAVKECYTDYRQMLRESKLDAVSVCTPNALHARHTNDALKANLAVLCEKPMASTVRQARSMLATQEQTGAKLVIGFQYRYDARTAFLKQAADDGQFGDVLYGRARALRRRGIPNWGKFGQKALQGGGPLMDIGVHVLEMAHYTMGSPEPVTTSADMFTYLGNKPSNRVQSMWSGWDYKTYDVEDLAIGRVRFTNGAVLNIESAYAAHIPGDEWNFELLGSAGGACWEPPSIHRDEAGHMVDTTPGWLAETSFQATFKRKMDNFVDHVLYDAPTLAPAADGLAVQRILGGLYRSASQGGKELKV